MEILRLEIQRENVGHQKIERGRDIPLDVAGQVGRRSERRRAAGFEIGVVHGRVPLWLRGAARRRY